MFTNTLHRYVLCAFAILSLSACESMHNSLSGDAGKPQPKTEVSNATDTVTPLPTPVVNQKKEMTSLDSSVEIFDMELNPEYRRGVSSPAQQSHASADSTLTYGEAFRTSDSSVTVYGLSDAPPNMATQPYGNNMNSAQAYNQNYAQAYGNAAGQIFFKHGSSRLGTGDMKKISSLAGQAKFAPVNHVTVEGFASKPTQAGTDTTQAHIINLRQSLKRAEKVSNALMHKGVPGEKLKTVSWGSAKATGNERHDRRVDVVMGER